MEARFPALLTDLAHGGANGYRTTCSAVEGDGGPDRTASRIDGPRSPAERGALPRGRRGHRRDAASDAAHARAGADTRDCRAVEPQDGDQRHPQSASAADFEAEAHCPRCPRQPFSDWPARAVALGIRALVVGRPAAARAAASRLGARRPGRPSLDAWATRIAARPSTIPIAQLAGAFVRRAGPAARRAPQAGSP